jgi:Tol biopolymer transport system component
MGIQQGRGRRWVRFAVPAVLAVFAAAGCGSATGHTVDSGGPAPAASDAAGATTKATQSGGALTSVGAGWTLAEYSASTVVSGGTARKAGATTLYLVSPQGVKKTLYRWAASQTNWSLLDWSGDKSRALFTGTTSNIVGQLVLATGKFSTIQLPTGTVALSYSRPDGAAILGVQQNSSGVKLLRFDLNGKLEQTLASGPANSTDNAIYSPDGTTLAVNGAKALELVKNSGGVARSLPVPGHPTCTPVRWWNSSTILASCLATGQSGSRLWLVPASGARPTALTQQRTAKGPDLGDINAYQLPPGLYLQATGACGVIFIAKQASDGSATTVTVPQTTGNDNRIVTAQGSRLLVRAQTSCQSSTSLLWFTPSSNAVQMLIKTPAGVEGVEAAIPYQPAG